MRIAAIIPAAGRGRRLKAGQAKAFVPLSGKPLLVHTLLNLKKCRRFSEIIVASVPSQRWKVSKLLARYGIRGARVIPGGHSRAASVRNAVAALSSRPDWVLVHDAARPFVGRELVKRLLKSARRTGAAICALPATATVRRIDPKRGITIGTEDRESLVLVQTPQVFRSKLLLERYRRLGGKALSVTDEAALFDRSPVKVTVIPGDPRNIKVTTREDLEWCRFYLKK